MLTLDWNTGEIQNSASDADGAPWSVVVAGDWAPRGGHVQALTESPTAFYGDLLPLLRDADLSLVNLECVLGDGGTPIVKDGPHMRAPAAAVAGLAAVPFTLACLANNHSMDYGSEGLAQTLRLLREHDIAAVGAGLSEADRQPFCVIIKDVRVAVVNVAEGEEGRARGEGPGVVELAAGCTAQHIAGLRQQVDVVIVVAHAGREFVPVPPPYIQRAYRALIDAGADLVVGHHPHVPQGVEIYHDRPIVYSLGNFAFWIPDGSPYLRLGYLFAAMFRGPRLQSVRLVPYKIEPGRLSGLAQSEQRAFLDALERVSGVLATPAQVEEMWDAYADHWYRTACADEVSTVAALLADGQALGRALLSRLATTSGPGLRGQVLRCLLRLLINRLPPEPGDGSDSLAAEQSRRGAAILHNRFDTPAHRALYLRALGRVMRRESGSAPAWARALLHEWEVA